MVATGSGDVGPNATQMIRTWDLEKLEQQPAELKCGSQVNAIAYSPDGKWLASGENDGTLTSWDIRAWTVQADLTQAHGGLGVSAITYLPGGKRLLTAGGDGVVMERTAADLQPVREVTKHAKSARAVVVFPDGKQAASVGLDAKIRVWDIAAGKVREWNAPAPINALAVSPDGMRLLTGHADGAIRLWDLTTQKEVVQFDGHEKGVTTVAFMPDGQSALSGGNDGAVCLWKLPR
jgi:WD40 repeat protein